MAKVEVLLEAADFVVVVKPHGWLSVPGRQADDPRPVLGRILEKQLGTVMLPVHRLDFEVGGVMLFAKNKDFHRVANSWFENKLVQKIYRAYSQGAPPPGWPEGESRLWKSKLVRGKKRAFEAPHGQVAETRARYMGPRNNMELLWLLEPITGRSHQLRFEMAKHGFPIVGDKLYGSSLDGGDKIALVACELRFTKIENRHGLPEKIVWQEKNGA